jgi:ABC-type Zn uptake system ZnuABC Zn-binding protein ZnuA
MMTREQEHVIEQALVRGLVKNHREAYEAGCAALRRQLQELKEEEAAKLEAAARAEAEAIALNQFKLV